MNMNAGTSIYAQSSSVLVSGWKMPRKWNVVRLAPTPIVIKYRKESKTCNYSFHKYSQQRDEAVERGDTKAATELDRKIGNMGGRK